MLLLRRRALVPALVLITLSGLLAGSAQAAEWPAELRFPLVEPPVPLHFYPPPSSIAEEADGSLLVLLYWPIVTTEDFGTSETPRTRLVRIAPDGSQTFVPPFGDLTPGGGGERISVEDEILPLPDGSILFTGYNAIDRLRPDGRIVRFAGTGRYSEFPSGDGGPAVAADIGFAAGLSRFPDASVVFADGTRVRRIAPDGTISTIAGSPATGGPPATDSTLRSPGDVLPTRDGGVLVADTYAGRVRKVAPDGAITTIAGTGASDIFVSSGDGGPATEADVALPRHLGLLPDGRLLIGGWQRIRAVAPDGTISTLLDVAKVHGNRLGDHAGRHGESIEAMEVTREGGVAVIVSGTRLRALDLAPRDTRRTLVGIHGTRASDRQVVVTVDATAAGRLQLQIRRRGELVAQSTRRIRAGTRVITASGRFARSFHDVSVTLRGERGSHGDAIRLFTSRTLPQRLVTPTEDPDVRACRRMTGRRIDCERHVSEDEEDGRMCLDTRAYKLFPSGMLFSRPYGPTCHRAPLPFDLRPGWTGPWVAWPPI